MEGSRVKIGFEKFDGKGSFTMWKVRVEDLLVQTGLDSALEDRPEEMNDKVWVSLEKRACATIRSCLADEVLYGVLEERSPQGLWSRLHQLYMGKNMCNKLMLKKQLYSLRMQEGGDVADHIQRFDRMSMDLLNIGVDLDEEDKSLLLLCSLPGSFDPLVTTLLYGKETLVYEDIISVLRSNEQRERMMQREVFQEGLAVSERPWKGKKKKSKHMRRGQSQGSSKGAKVCYRCGVAGHFKRECPLRKKAGESTDSESIGTVAGSDGSDELMVVSEEPAGCGVSGTASEGSAECGGSGGAATVYEVQQQAQQDSVEWLASGDSGIESGTSEALGGLCDSGGAPRLRCRCMCRDWYTTDSPRVQEKLMRFSGIESGTSVASGGLQFQVEHRAEVALQVEQHVSGRTVTECAVSARGGTLQGLQGSPGKMMRLSGRREATIHSRMVQRSKPGSSVVEAVIPEVSRSMQRLKRSGRGKGRTGSCQGRQGQQGAGGHCQVCQGLGAPRWRL